MLLFLCKVWYTSTLSKIASKTIYLKFKIVGTWKFFLTNPVKKTIQEQYKLTCGHSNPSHELTAYKFNMDQSLFQSSIELDLKESDNAILTDGNQKLVNK